MHQFCAIGTYLRQLSKKICLWFKDKQVFSKLSESFFSPSPSLPREKLPKEWGSGAERQERRAGGRIKGGGEETFCLSLFVWYLDQFFWEGISVSVGWVAEAGAFYPSSMNKEVLSSQ